MESIFCIGCGCSDDDACEGGCTWAAVDEELGAGLCSQCAVKPLEQLLANIETAVAVAAGA